MALSMMIHIYRYGDRDGLHIDTSRVTLREPPQTLRSFAKADDSRTLIMGTLPHVTVIPFTEIEWFWIEES